jgi:drug/metabolite transporter (DMT)-like permease
MEPLPARRGALLALAAALLFGASTPLVQRLGEGLGSFATASLLYAGAAIAGALMQRPVRHEAGIGWRDAGRLALVALSGAALAPVALAWGLQHTSAISASLLLTLEAVFTAVLARVLHRETLDARVSLALALVTLGAMTLIVDQGAAGTTRLAGILAVAGATAAWALDNTLSRSLASRDPGQVVFAKATLGALATAALAALLGEPRPGLAAALGLLGVGATAYGLSQRLYLLAQRSFGAARTGSVFAFAPFAGALVALAMGDRPGGAWMLAGAVLMVAGVMLHLTERHDHVHEHAALEHEHAHRHDDGHHDHTHDAPPEGAHNHWHRHAPQRHSHPHVPDAHHDHRH